MKNLYLSDCLDFQEIFRTDHGYSPYENIEEPHKAFVLIFLGEIGSLLNNYCKKYRSKNNYQSEMEDESLDLFIYLILWGLIAEKGDRSIFSHIEAEWDSDPYACRSEEDFRNNIFRLVNELHEIDKDKDGFNAATVQEMFRLIKSIGLFATNRSWQDLVDEGHRNIALRHTDPSNYSAGLRYKANGYVNLNLLREWIALCKVDLPTRHTEFMEQSALAPPRQ